MSIFQHFVLDFFTKALEDEKAKLKLPEKAKVINKNKDKKNTHCKFFLRGSCRRGHRCRFLHSEEKKQAQDEKSKDAANKKAIRKECNGGKSTLNKVKEMWKNDPTSKLVIKCGGIDIETIKPLLAASSSVFKAMFEANMIEARESIIEIVDFKPEVVKKMVEFCENEKISDFENLEDDVFKIAHKYQIANLMARALQKMTKTTSLTNVLDRLKLAELYGLEEFKKQCLKYGKF